jgi:phosphate transport system substrate-binding protein
LISPPLLPLAAEWLQNFNLDTSQPEIQLIPMGYSAAVELLEDDAAAILITSQAPPSGWWATPLGSEPIAVVTNAANPVDQLTRNELIQILSGQATEWEPWTDQSTPIEVIFPFQGDELRARFLDQLSPGLHVTSNARLAANPAMVIELVAEEVGRIGILPFSLVNPQINDIQIDGAQPDEEEYPFMMEMLATAPQEPEGVVRQWLVWLQENLEISLPDVVEPEATRTDEPATPSASSDDSSSTATPPPTRTPSASQTAN